MTDTKQETPSQRYMRKRMERVKARLLNISTWTGRAFTMRGNVPPYSPMAAEPERPEPESWDVFVDGKMVGQYLSFPALETVVSVLYRTFDQRYQ